MQRPVTTPAFFEKHALALWPRRWRLGNGTFVALVSFTACLVVVAELGLSNAWRTALGVALFIGMCWPSGSP